MEPDGTDDSAAIADDDSNSDDYETASSEGESEGSAGEGGGGGASTDATSTAAEIAPCDINHLPDEVLVILFCFADSKTLMITVPSVS